jgi:hypothetical protein
MMFQARVLKRDRSGIAFGAAHFTSLILVDDASRTDNASRLAIALAPEKPSNRKSKIDSKTTP